VLHNFPLIARTFDEDRAAQSNSTNSSPAPPIAAPIEGIKLYGDVI
jgi:hypothetical protein